MFPQEFIPNRGLVRAMGPEKLVQRGSVYGSGAGIVTTGVVVLVASLFDAVLAVVLLVLIAIAVLALALLLGLPEGDPALRVRRWVPVKHRTQWKVVPR